MASHRKNSKALPTTQTKTSSEGRASTSGAVTPVPCVVSRPQDPQTSSAAEAVSECQSLEAVPASQSQTPSSSSSTRCGREAERKLKRIDELKSSSNSGLPSSGEAVNDATFSPPPSPVKDSRRSVTGSGRAAFQRGVPLVLSSGLLPAKADLNSGVIWSISVHCCGHCQLLGK